MSNPPTAAEDACVTLMQAFALLQRVMAPYFAKFGISASQWSVLRTLGRYEKQSERGLRLVDLSERLGVRPPSITAAVDRLVKLGLVARVAATDDHRSKRVQLTDSGRMLVARVQREYPCQLSALMAGLRVEKQVQLRALLTATASHLESLLETASAPGAAEMAAPAVGG